jgi:hypothetical protein
MKKVFFLLVGFALTTAVMAQKDKAADTKKLQNTIADKKEDKHEVGKDLEHLRIESAMKKRKEVRAHKKVIHKTARDLKENHGVEHPIKDAKKVVKAKKDAKNGKD